MTSSSISRAFELCSMLYSLDEVAYFDHENLLMCVRTLEFWPIGYLPFPKGKRNAAEGGGFATVNRKEKMHKIDFLVSTIQEQEQQELPFLSIYKTGAHCILVVHAILARLRYIKI